MRVVLAARRADRLAGVADQVRAGGGEARVVPTDVADEAAVRALVDGTVDAWGRLDVLVNNAGVGILATVEQTTAAEFERILRVNFLGAVYGVRAALPHMRQERPHRQRGLCDRQAGEPLPRRVRRVEVRPRRLLRGLRLEVHGTGIHVTCVCPIGTATEFHEVELNRLGVPGRGGPIQSADHVARAILRRSAGRGRKSTPIRRPGSCSSRTRSRRGSSTA